MTPRRSALAALASLATGAAQAVATSHPDARLIAACIEHGRALDACNALPPEVDLEDGVPAFDRYTAACSTITTTSATTMEGIIAKSRACMRESAGTSDRDDPFAGTFASGWAHGVLRDLLRLHAEGGA